MNKTHLSLQSCLKWMLHRELEVISSSGQKKLWLGPKYALLARKIIQIRPEIAQEFYGVNPRDFVICQKCAHDVDHEVDKMEAKTEKIVKDKKRTMRFEEEEDDVDSVKKEENKRLPVTNQMVSHPLISSQRKQRQTNMDVDDDEDDREGQLQNNHLMINTAVRCKGYNINNHASVRPNTPRNQDNIDLLETNSVLGETTGTAEKEVTFNDIQNPLHLNKYDDNRIYNRGILTSGGTVRRDNSLRIENKILKKQVNSHARSESKIDSDQVSNISVKIREKKCRLDRVNLAENDGDNTTRNSGKIQTNISVIEEPNWTPSKFSESSPFHCPNRGLAPLLSNTPSIYFIALERYSDWLFEWTPPELIELKMSLFKPKRNDVVQAWLTSDIFRLNFRPLPSRKQQRKDKLKRQAKDASVQTDCIFRERINSSIKRNKLTRLKDWMQKWFKVTSQIKEGRQNEPERDYQDIFFDEKLTNERCIDQSLAAPCIENSTTSSVACNGTAEKRTRDSFCFTKAQLRSTIFNENEHVVSEPGISKDEVIPVSPALRYINTNEPSQYISRVDLADEYAQRTSQYNTRPRTYTNYAQLAPEERTSYMTTTTPQIGHGVNRDRSGPSKRQVHFRDDNLESIEEDAGKYEGIYKQTDQKDHEEDELDRINSDSYKLPAEIQETISRFDEVRRKFLELASDLRSKALNITDNISHEDETINEKISDKSCTARGLFSRLRQNNKVYPAAELAKQNAIKERSLNLNRNHQSINEEELQELSEYIEKLLERKRNLERSVEVKALWAGQEEFNRRDSSLVTNNIPSHRMERSMRETYRRRFAHHNHLSAINDGQRTDSRDGCIGCQLLVSSQIYGNSKLLV